MQTVTVEQANAQRDAAVATERQAGETKLAAQAKENEGAVAKAGTDAAAAESARIKGVLALGKKTPGHDALIDEMAYDGKTTPDQAKARLFDAEAQKRAGKKDELNADAPAPVPAAAAPADEPAKKDENEDPYAIAQKAQAYIAEQGKLGITVSAAQAVAHVTAQKESK